MFKKIQLLFLIKRKFIDAAVFLLEKLRKVLTNVVAVNMSYKPEDLSYI